MDDFYHIDFFANANKDKISRVAIYKSELQTR